MEGREPPKPFKTWSMDAVQPPPAMPPAALHPLAFVYNLLNDDSVRKFYQNEVLQVKQVKLRSYDDIAQIRAAFESCAGVNDPAFDPAKLKDAVFYVLRSTCDDDIHKAIKYACWTSTTKTNQQLNESFHYCQRRGIPLYLVFTVVSSKQFCGVAEMRSEVQFGKIFNYWWEEVKWSGLFRLRWLYVKDLHHEDVKELRDGGTPVVHMKDGSRLSFEAGQRLLLAFQRSEFVSNIFEEFEGMDQREEKLRFKRDGFYEVIKQLKARGLIAPPEPGGRRGERRGQRGGSEAEYLPKRR